MELASHQSSGKARLLLVKTDGQTAPELPTFLLFLFYLEGYSCAGAEDAVESNPYDKGTAEQIAWQNGWQEYRQSH